MKVQKIDGCVFVSVILGRLSGAFLLNCELFALTLLFALPLGLVVSFGSMSRCKPLSAAVKTFVWIIRGTPLMLQIIVIYLGPGLLGMTNPWPSGSGGRTSTMPATSRRSTAAASRQCPKARPRPGRCWA